MIALNNAAVMDRKQNERTKEAAFQSATGVGDLLPAQFLAARLQRQTSRVADNFESTRLCRHFDTAV